MGSPICIRIVERKKKKKKKKIKGPQNFLPQLFHECGRQLFTIYLVRVVAKKKVAVLEPV